MKIMLGISVFIAFCAPIYPHTHTNIPYSTYVLTYELTHLFTYIIAYNNKCSIKIIDFNGNNSWMERCTVTL